MTAALDPDLRRIAEAADADGHPWYWTGGYPQRVIREGDAVLVADVFESPDAPSRFAEFIATFDPPVALALVEIAKQARAELRRQGCLCLYSRCPIHGESTGALAAALARLDSGATEENP